MYASSSIQCAAFRSVSAWFRPRMCSVLVFLLLLLLVGLTAFESARPTPPRRRAVCFAWYFFLCCVIDVACRLTCDGRGYHELPVCLRSAFRNALVVCLLN